MAENPKKPLLRKTLRCAKCNSFLCEVTILQEVATGPIVRLRGLRCLNRKCRFKNDPAVGNVGEGSQKDVKDALMDLFEKDQKKNQARPVKE